MSPIRTAVIGTGHLGRIHARLAKASDDLDLVGIVDPNPRALAEVAAECDVPAAADWRELPVRPQAVIVAAPTAWHHELASGLLHAGIDVLVEKPITSTTDQAHELVDLARRSGRVLQVGHVERFNPAFEEFRRTPGRPKFVETRRMSEYTFRSTDVGVVLDLMIHDLDLVLSLVEAEVVKVDAVGISVMGRNEDIAQARLEFADGAVANLVASRCSFQRERSIQMFTDRGFASADLTSRLVKRIAPRSELLDRSVDFVGLPADAQQSVREGLFTDWLPVEACTAPQANAIAEEHRDFAASIRQGRMPRVSGEHGTRALQVAERIVQEIREHAWYGPESAARGPLAMPLPRVFAPAADNAPQAPEIAAPVRRAG